MDATTTIYHYRLVTNDDADTAFNKITSALKKPVKKTKPHLLCVVAAEISRKGKPHIHAYIDTNITQQTLRARLKLIHSGNGNAEYSLETKRTDNLLSYVIKAGNFRYSPEMAESIQNCPKWVEPSADFEKSYALLKDDYITGDMTDYEFIYQTLGLYSDHKKAIYTSRIRSQWLGVANQRNRQLDCTYRYRVSGNGRPFRHRLVEEIMRGFYIYDN